MGEIIDLECLETWPRDLTSYLDDHHELFLNWELDSASVATAEYDRAIYGLFDVLKRYSLTGWHCTRLTQKEIETVVCTGMQLPNAQMLSRRITTLERDQVINSEVAARLRAENQANDIHRANKIWFCFFPPGVAGEDGIGRFFRSWGGEGLYTSHEDDPQTGTVLRTIGRPCLVEADVPIASLPVHGGLTFKIVRRFLISHRYETSEPVDHEDRTERALSAASVRRIMIFPDPDFVRLTGCDTWKPPLQ